MNEPDEFENTPLPPPPPQQQRTSISARLSRLGITFVVLAVLWLVFSQVAPRVMLHGDNATPAPDSQSIDPLEMRVKALEDKFAALPKSSADVDTKIAELTAKIAALPQVSQADAEQLAHMDDEIKALQGSVDSASAKNAAFSALAQIREAMTSGQGFAAPLTQLKNLAPDQKSLQDAINQLAPFADKGVDTLGDLQQNFEHTVSSALSPDAHSFMGGLHSLITIRKVGEPAGHGDQEVIARAESKLNRADVAAALIELSQLSPQAATAFSNWVKTAQAWSQAHDALAHAAQALSDASHA